MAENERMSGSERDTQTSSSVAPAAASTNAGVDTEWFVDYNKVGGKSTRSADRDGSDLLVVNELKFAPNRGQMQSLAGGNAALSGQVSLGHVSLPPSSGVVTAAVQYGKHSNLKLELKLSGPSSTKQKHDLDTARADASASLDRHLKTSGDFGAIAIALQSEFQDRFPGSTLTVALTPLLGKGVQVQTARGGRYDASEVRSFLVTIDPQTSTNYETNYSKTESTEKNHGSHDNSQTSFTSQLKAGASVEQVTKTTKDLQISLSDQVAETFGLINEKLKSKDTKTSKRHEEDVKWKVGVTPEKSDDDSKDKDKSKKDEAGSKPGFAHRLGQFIIGKVKWAGKAVSWIKDGVKDLVGGAIGLITGRGYAERTSDDNNSNDKVVDDQSSEKDVQSFQDVHTFATTVVGKFMSEESESVKAYVETELGFSAQKSGGTDDSNKTNTTTQVSGKTVVHEQSDLLVSVQPKG
ncbi:MAG: hypothetical protein QM831_33605 [Kofleriaceae bacterium]